MCLENNIPIKKLTLPKENLSTEDINGEVTYNKK